MKFNYSILMVLLIIAASAFTLKNYVVKSDPTYTPEVEAKTWTSVEEAVSLAKIDQKKVLVDVYTDWCKWCKVMDEKTFSDPEVSKFLAKNYHLAKFNAEQKDIVTFKGKAYKFIKKDRRGYHQFALEALDGRLAYPSLVVFDSELNKLQVIRGFKNAHQLLEILRD